VTQTTGWRTIPLIEAAEVTLGQSPPGDSYNDTGAGIPFFQGKSEFTATVAEVRKFTTAGTKFAKGGDILVSVRAPVGPTNFAPVDCAIGRGLAALRARAGVDQRYLFWAMRATEAELAKHGAGSTFTAVTGKQLKAHPVSIAPTLDRQRDIVDLLENHLSRLDSAESLVATSLRRVTSLRRSVLAGLHGGDSTPLGELAVDSGYGTSEKCVASGPGPAVVRIPNLIRGRIDLSDEKRVASASADVERYRLIPGDLLIVRTNGSVDLIGRSAVVQGGVDAAFASYLIRYQLRSDRVIPEWVQAMLSTPQVRAKIERLAASSAGQHNLSLGKLDPLELPVPALEVQAAHLSHLADIEDEVDRLRVELSAAQARGVNLRQSILTAAFSGRLSGGAFDRSESKEVINA
jgi:type I restriction enzyme S subunit